MSKVNPLSIKEIKVEKLFGYYTYSIPNTNSSDISKLLILYGDNGSGKTTLLKLLFWLLSSKDRSGHKSKIAETKFSHFSIIFQNGIEIGATRDKGVFQGSFHYYIKKNTKIIYTLGLKATQKNSIVLDEDSKDQIKFTKMLEYIKQLNISVFFLSDDRKILNSISSSENDHESQHEFIINDSSFLSRDYDPRVYKRAFGESKIVLDRAVERLIDWIRQKVIIDSKTGEKNSQAIFTDIIRNVFKPNEDIKKAKSKTDLIKQIEIIEGKVTPYIDLGLIDKFDSRTIKTTINQSKNPTQLRNLRTILAPYIESINAKLAALEKLKDVIYLFINSINQYFTYKKISFNLNSGFKLTQKEGDSIEFDLLSSGEKQLLLLFINTITAADVATIFIIDEPEISLNIKWQRNLIDTLLKFSIDKNIQYILSTHSIELLSANIDNVTKLEDQNARA